MFPEVYKPEKDHFSGLYFYAGRCPGIGSMGKSMEFMGRPWFPHASLAFPCSAKAWERMGSMVIFFKPYQ